MNKKKTHEEFMRDFKERFPENFDKIEVLGKYDGCDKKIKCRCKVNKNHADWEIAPDRLLIGKGVCPRCAKTKQTSLFEQVIYEVFKEALGKDKVLHRDKSLIGKELDIYVPSLKIAYEPGSWFWHSNSTEKDYDKFLLCKEKGIKLITIYDAMGKDVELEFEYNVVKYEKSIKDKADIINFIETQFKELNLKNKIVDWDKIFKIAKDNCKGITHEDFIRRFEERQPESFKKITILGNYVGHDVKILCECNVNKEHGTWETTPGVLLKGCGCPKCGGKKKKSHEEFMKNFEKKQPELFKVVKVLSRYTTATKEIRCMYDGYKWITTPARLLIGSKYNYRKVDEYKWRKLEAEDMLLDFKEKHPDFCDIFELDTNLTKQSFKIKIKCKECGSEKYISFEELTKNKYYCKECANLKKELIVKENTEKIIELNEKREVIIKICEFCGKAYELNPRRTDYWEVRKDNKRSLCPKDKKNLYIGAKNKGMNFEKYVEIRLEKLKKGGR